MGKKKIAIIVPSLGVGGAENMVAQLSVHLNKDQFNPLLIVLGPKVQTPIQEYLDKYSVNTLYLNKGLGINYKIILDMYKLLNEFDPDLVHTHLHAFAYVFPWIMKNKVKMLHTVHNMPEFELSAKGKRLISILYRMNKAIPVAISNIIKSEMEDTYTFSNIETIYNPVEIRKYYNNRETIVGKSPTFINIGRLNPQKNQSLLLNSFALVLKELPNAKLKIAGEGDLKDELINLSDELGIHKSVEFLGVIKEPYIELGKSDIFVLSSDYEGLPLTVLEAMAAALPIISTSVGGVPDIVTDNGVLVEPRNERELAKAMINLATDNNSIEKMGQNSLSNVQKFDVENITKEYENLYLKYSR